MSLEVLKELGDATYYGNELRAWGEAFVTFGLWFTVLPLARATIGRRLAKRTADRPVNFLLLLRALIDATTRVFMFAIAIYLALRWLKIPPRAEKLVDTSILVVTWWQVGHWLSALVRHLIEVRRGREFAGTEGAASLNILRFVAVMIVWIIGMNKPMRMTNNAGIKKTAMCPRSFHRPGRNDASVYTTTRATRSTPKPTAIVNSEFKSSFMRNPQFARDERSTLPQISQLPAGPEGPAGNRY